MPAVDALVLVSFGGPEGQEQVMPFLEHVTAGRPVPAERLAEVALHYRRFGGVSPINEQNRLLLAAVRRELEEAGLDMAVYWGNRHSPPWLHDAVAQMASDGVRRAAAFVTSAYSSYSSCRQYIEAIDAARAEAGPSTPEVVKLRPFFNHPGFVASLAEALSDARRAAGPDAPVLFSAHSIPLSQAAGCSYEQQLQETARLVAERSGLRLDQWSLAYQSRSGPPEGWLGPDVEQAVEALPEGTESVVVAPIGFVSDHMEVAYDLDVVLRERAEARGLQFVRAATPGTHPAFVAMVRQLVEELDGAPRLAVGSLGPQLCPCETGCPARA